MSIIIDGNNTPTTGYAAFGNGGKLDFAYALQINPSGFIGLGGASPSLGSRLTVFSGDPTCSSIVLSSGTRRTLPTSGSIEYDGNLYFSNDDVSGQGYVPAKHFFRLAADGTAIGPAIADFFGAGSSLLMQSGTICEMVYYCFFTKTTAGTVTFTITSSLAPQNVNGIVQIGAIAGGTAVGAANQIALFKSTSAAAAFGATGTLTTAVNHAAIIRVMYEANASSIVDARLRVTCSAGTVTPLRGSYYEVTQLPSLNTGQFA